MTVLGPGLLRRRGEAPRTGPPSVGSDFDSPGPFPVTTQSDATTTVYSPAELGSNGRVQHPVILWGNAGGTSVAWYDPLLRHLASHGIIVAAANTARPGTGAEMLRGLATLRTWSREPRNRFYRRVNLDSVGSTGHSQGGRGAINAAKDPAVTTSAPIQPWPHDEDGLRGSGTAISSPPRRTTSSLPGRCATATAP